MSTNTIFPFLKVVTVEDSVLIATRLNSLLNEIEGLQYLGNASDFSSGKNLIDSIKPDAAILDICLAGDEPETGIDLLIEIRRNHPQLKIIIFTNHNELHYRLVCLEKGADYFFDKSKDAHKISDVLRLWTLKK